MSRRRQAVRRPVIKDAKYNSTLVSRLVNTVMGRGKKTVAQRIVYGAFDEIATKNPATNPLDILQRAVDNDGHAGIRIPVRKCRNLRMLRAIRNHQPATTPEMLAEATGLNAKQLSDLQGLPAVVESGLAVRIREQAHGSPGDVLETPAAELDSDAGEG